MFEFAKKSTENLLIAAIIFTFIFLGSIYARMIKLSFIFLLITALLWIVFVEEVRLEQCNAACPTKK